MSKHHKKKRRKVSGDPRRRAEPRDHVDFEVRILDPNMTPAELQALRPNCGECGAKGRFLDTAEDIQRYFGPVPPTLPPLTRYWGCQACGARGTAGFM